MTDPRQAAIDALTPAWIDTPGLDLDPKDEWWPALHVPCPDCGGRGLARTWVAVDRIASDPGLSVCATCDGAGWIAERRRTGRWSRLAVLLALAFAAGWMAGHADASAPRSAQPAPTGSAGRSGAPIGDATARTRAVEPATMNDPAHEAVDGASPSPTPAPTPAAVARAASVSGVSSWYCSASSPCTRGYDPTDLVGAAGPALRDLLGPDWRGRVVTVTAGDRSVQVRLVDWCRCPGDRVVDLTSGAFARLASLGRGLVRVTVSW